MLSLFTGAYTSFIKFGIVVAVVLTLYGGYRYQLSESYKEGVKATEIKYEAQILAQNEVLSLKKKSADKELEQKLTKTKEENDVKIKNLNLRVGTLLGSLSSRPERPTASGNNPSTPTTEGQAGTTGQGLYKIDAEFLVRYSSDTETLKLSLIQCYKDYDAVKQSVESFTTK
jgi:hypothetical protein